MTLAGNAPSSAFSILFLSFFMVFLGWRLWFYTLIGNIWIPFYSPLWSVMTLDNAVMSTPNRQYPV